MFRVSGSVFYDTLLRCRGAFARIAEKRGIWHGLVVYLLVKFLVYLTAINFSFQGLRGIIIFPPELAHFITEEMLLNCLPILPLSTAFLHLSFGPLYFFFMVAVLHLVAVFLGGQNRISNLGAVFGYAYLPYLFVAAGILLARCTGFNMVLPLLILAFTWSLWLKITGLRLVHNFSWGRALLVFFMPALAFMLSILVFLLFAIAFLIPIILQVMENFSLGFPLA